MKSKWTKRSIIELIIAVLLLICAVILVFYTEDGDFRDFGLLLCNLIAFICFIFSQRD